MTGPLYSVDTSALIDGLERYYPEAHFPALWGRVDDLIAEGRFLISEEVLEEVNAKDEPAKEWVKPRVGELVVPTDATVITRVQGILSEHELLVKNMKGRNRADPFVIAVAAIRGANVVTGEGADGTALRPKIPYVCKKMGIECIRFLDILRLENWSF